MDLKSHIDSQVEWENYRDNIRRAFHNILNNQLAFKYKKIKEVRIIISKIDWRFREISRLKVKIRQDHKEEFHQVKIDRWKSEVNELIEVLNENFVLEILLGD